MLRFYICKHGKGTTKVLKDRTFSTLLSLTVIIAAFVAHRWATLYICGWQNICGWQKYLKARIGLKQRSARLRGAPLQLPIHAPHTQEAEGRGSWVWDQTELHSETLSKGGRGEESCTQTTKLRKKSNIKHHSFHLPDIQKWMLFWYLSEMEKVS